MWRRKVDNTDWLGLLGLLIPVFFCRWISCWWEGVEGEHSQYRHCRICDRWQWRFPREGAEWMDQ